MAMPVSFVIPVLNEQATVAALLHDLRRRYPAGELIVVDGGSEDRTVEIAMPLCDQLVGGRVESVLRVWLRYSDLNAVSSIDYVNALPLSYTPLVILPCTYLK